MNQYAEENYKPDAGLYLFHLPKYIFWRRLISAQIFFSGFPFGVYYTFNLFYSVCYTF